MRALGQSHSLTSHTRPLPLSPRHARTSTRWRTEDPRGLRGDSTGRAAVVDTGIMERGNTFRDPRVRNARRKLPKLTEEQILEFKEVSRLASPRLAAAALTVPATH